MFYVLGIVLGSFLGAVLYFRIGRFIGEKKWELGRHFKRSFETFLLFPVSCMQGERPRAEYYQFEGEERYIYAYDHVVSSSISERESVYMHALLWPLFIAWNVLCLFGIAGYLLVSFCIFGFNRTLKEKTTSEEVDESDKLRISDESQNTDSVEAKTLALEALRERRDKAEEAIAVLEAELEIEEDLKVPTRTHLHVTRH